ncbi:hypothetical protein [Chelativorans sp. Marseille-P2723]|uniref:hypothetical protein n=1 Tax=Chelativorans sp. Marseille-P2723 TaxID=2709133 RepID=UPI00156F3CB6|nr:hypothetical protein [Chelativorans sp. Marseille-P2723]
MHLAGLVAELGEPGVKVITAPSGRPRGYRPHHRCSAEARFNYYENAGDMSTKSSRF